MLSNMDVKVCVECMTFNQSSYIKDTLDGFCMQQTTFPYVCVVMDDASSDGEQEVISNYLKGNFKLNDKVTFKAEETNDYSMIFAQHANNNNCYFAVFYLKYNHYREKKNKLPYHQEWRNSAKYIAMCEGDDYWTLPEKLQIQYDYMESHPDVVLSCHRYSVLDVTTGQTELKNNSYFDYRRHFGEKEFEFDMNFFLSSWITKTLTNMYRRAAIKDDYYVGYKFARDVHFNYYVMTKGKGVCHAFNGGIYRKNVPTGTFGNLGQTEKDEINSKVLSELAEVTHDHLVRKIANILIVRDCMNRLKPIGGGYYYALKVVDLIQRFKELVKRGGRRCVPPIS